MRNANLLVAGATGSGKSTMTDELIKLSARVMVLDRMDEYDVGDHVSLDFAEGSKWFLEHRREGFKHVLRMSTDEQYAMLKLAIHVQNTEKHGPLVVVMDEATEDSTAWEIGAAVHELYAKGRHYRISSITIVQMDTDINRITKHSSAAVVSFKQNYLSTNWARFFTWDQIQALTLLDDDYGKPYKIPQQDHHFIVHPSSITDLYHWWWQRHGYLGRLR